MFVMFSQCTYPLLYLYAFHSVAERTAKVYEYLISERERIHNITQDRNVTESLDRTIIAVGQVVNHCKAMRDLDQKRENI